MPCLYTMCGSYLCLASLSSCFYPMFFSPCKCSLLGAGERWRPAGCPGQGGGQRADGR